MTWNRRLAVIGLFMVLVCIGIELAMLLTPDHRPGVTKANFDKLEVGMSKEQVECLLVNDGARLVHARGLRSGTERSVWFSEVGAIADISYSVQNLDDRTEWKVDSMTWTDATETTWQRVRRWLRIPA